MHEPRFTQPIQRTIVVVIVAIESGTIAIVYTALATTGASGLTIRLALAALLLPILLIATSRLTIRLRDDRLAWSFRPFWFGSVAYDRVVNVEVVEVDAMRDFNGWGPKYGTRAPFKRAFGAIARSGPAIRIEREDKKRDLVLTCDDADTLAAQLLERALRARGAEAL